MHPYFTVFSKQIPAYGVMMVMGLLVAGSVGMVRTKHCGQRWENAAVILACAFGFALFGASGLYLIVTYSPMELFEKIVSGELFSAKQMGLVFYGGLVGAIPGAYLGARIARADLSDYIPAMVPCIPLGHAFGRIGCLLAGCCYGLPTDLPIGVIYPETSLSAPAGIRLFPVQALESLILIGIFAILSIYTRKERRSGCVVGLYFLLYAVCRFGTETLRFDAIRGRFGAWSTSQWISMALFVAGGILLWRFRGSKMKN